MKPSNDTNWGGKLDVGFSEADIIASISEASQGHIKWIYDCLLARMGSDVALRLSQSKREELMKRSVEIYSDYLKETLKTQGKDFFKS